MEDREILQYKVGGLLYMPAYQENIVEKIRRQKNEHLTSICFCLEDAIGDLAVEDAERALRTNLAALKEVCKEEGRETPLSIFSISWARRATF